jgi:hypothetical protein
MEAISGSVRFTAFCAFADKERKPVLTAKHIADLVKNFKIFMI